MQWQWRSLILKTWPLISGVSLCGLCCINPATAQITPDGTVPTTVKQSGTVFNITGGTQVGTNLFHSFKDFSVPTHNTAYFQNTLQIQNIFSRVTGTSASSIDGVLKANGSANLFLLNPKGIIFGPNASLNIGGSFLATTADAFVFNNGWEFSATNPQAVPLLTVNIPIGLRFRDNPGSIVNQSVVGLQVQPAQSLLLVGGNVTLDGGEIIARGGRVELGGLSLAGTVGINSDGSWSFPPDVQRADVSLTGGAFVYVIAGGGGSIGINARNVNVLTGSVLAAGIGARLGSVGAVAGDITLNATGETKVADSSLIFNGVLAGGVGKGGGVKITTGSLAVTNGAQLIAGTYGQGDAGSVTITARDTATFDGVGSNGYPSGAFSRVEAGALGKGGGVNITTGSLAVTNSAQLSAGTSGQGDGGSVTITARDTATFDGVGSSGHSSGAFSSVEAGALGKGGGVNITTGSLAVTNGAQLNASTYGQGDAGSITITARDTVTFDGVGSNGSPSALGSQVGAGGVGKGGGVNITTGSLAVTNGAQLNASTYGQGDAGSLTIIARDTATFDGVGSNGGSSGAFSQVLQGALGKGGGVNITTGSLAVTNGAQLNANTYGQGDAGSLTIIARDTVTFDGVGSNGSPSGLSSEVGAGAVGKGGGVNITTGSLAVTNGAQLIAGTYGQGDAGSLTITARDRATFDGVESNGGHSGAFSEVGTGAVGKGGGVKITTGSLAVTNGAQLIAGTSGQGDAGSITITARDTATFDGVGSNGHRSALASQVGPGAVGKGGGVNITTGSLAVINGAELSASTFGQGDAGSITITARDTATFDGVGSNRGSSGAFSDVEAGALGKGGGVNITTGSLAVTNGAQLAAGTYGQGDAGSVTITARDTATFDGVGSNGGPSGAFSSVQAGGVGNGGGVKITTGSLAVTNGAQLAAGTYGQGDAGSITITARNTATFDGVGSNGGPSGAFSQVAQGAVGKGGDIQIQAQSLSLTNGAVLNANNLGNGAAGSIKVTTTKDILLDNGASIISNTSGGQGNITLLSRDLFLRHKSDITTNATGSATGGNITIDTGNLVAVPKENSDISANAQESFGGRISITAAGIFGTQFRPHLTPLSDITATSNLGPQFNGTVQLNILSPDPSRGLAELPHNVFDPASQIAQNPCTRGKSSEFTITGRGGLPPNPNEALNSDAVSVGLVEPTSSNLGRARSAAPVPIPKSAIPNPIVPAQGWVFNQKGQVVLTAYNPAVNQPQRPWLNPGACHTP